MNDLKKPPDDLTPLDELNGAFRSPRKVEAMFNVQSLADVQLIGTVVWLSTDKDSSPKE